LRRIDFFDTEQKRHLIFLTNNFDLPPETIAQLYKSRWRVELFFKWIKQHLRIKAFYGTSDNAVRTQVWIAVAVYVLVAIIKKRLAVPLSLYSMLQILSINAVNKIHILWAFSEQQYHTPAPENRNQLTLQGLFIGH
jgi:IS4 transposase